MEKDQLHERLTALDGLRGFAIILVFLNHINTGFIQVLLPSWLFGWIFSNGVTGVTFLFILSGFLMSTLYAHPKSATAFLQKRYTRIFPLFLTMCAIMFVGRITQTKSPFVFLEILVGFSLCTYILWMYVIKKLPKIYGTLLFFFFLLIQVFAGFFYIFWINKESFAAFSSLPFMLHEGFVFLINATLTLPLGQYIPMLDGVYWTLVAEVLFYILYPTVVVPLATFLARKSLLTKLFFLFSLFFFFGGIHILSYKIFVLSLIQPALFFYFATGVFLGYLYRNHTPIFAIFSTKIFKGFYNVVPFVLFFATVALVNDLSFLGQTISPWIRMIFAIPLTFFVAVLLDKKTLFSKLFSLQSLVFIGTVSYSIYLSHSLTIHVATLLAMPNNIFTDIVYVFIVFLVTVLVASFLFFFLERPYFIRKKETKIKNIPQKTQRVFPTKYIFIGMTTLYLLGIFAAYQSKDSYSFFSFQKPLPLSAFSMPKLIGQQTISLKDNSHVQIALTNLPTTGGLLSLQMSHTPVRSVQPQALQFSLFEKGSTKPLTIATYSLDQFNKNIDFPFGFSPIANTNNKIYIADFVLTNPQSRDSVRIYPNTAKLVASANKKELLTHPAQLANFFSAKILTIVQNPQAQLAFLLLIPFFLFSLIA
ncbi:MAG TPA: acyltransferase [Patescibacteria group bacterium]|nr:acyltransferase [Patescibacteria group bacterium]